MLCSFLVGVSIYSSATSAAPIGFTPNQVVVGSLVETSACLTGNFSVAARVFADELGNIEILSTQVENPGPNGILNSRHILYKLSTNSSFVGMSFAPTPANFQGNWSGSAQPQPDGQVQVNLTLSSSELGGGCSITLIGNVVSVATGL